ncbi:MAG: PfkB family carbohydrate kinase, partial [Bacteroidota bacterium]
HPITGVVLQDYNKGIFTVNSIDRILELIRKHDIPYFIDPKFSNFWKFQGATLFKPNRKELMDANSSHKSISFQEIMKSSAHKLKCEILMCTLAEKGIAYVEEDKLFYSPADRIDVVDVSGAGDTSLSIMVLAYLLGYDTSSIATLANLSGKVVCMKSGVSIMTLDELKSAYFSREETIEK